jgi:hypothetical protein
LNERHQASGIRHQGGENEAGVPLAKARFYGEAQLTPEMPAAVATGQENLKPETCSLKPSAKADN